MCTQVFLVAFVNYYRVVVEIIRHRITIFGVFLGPQFGSIRNSVRTDVNLVVIFT
jgi:hypothetical protein